MGGQQQFGLPDLIEQLDSVLDGEGAGTVDDRVNRAIEVASSWPWPAVDEALDRLTHRYRSTMEMHSGRPSSDNTEGEILDSAFPALAACLRITQKRDVKERPAVIRCNDDTANTINFGRHLKRLRVAAFLAGLLLWLVCYPVEKDGVIFFVGFLLLFYPTVNWAQWLMGLDVSGWLSKRWPSLLSRACGTIWWIGVIVGYVYLVKAVGTFFLV